MWIPLYGRFWQEGEDVGGEAIVIANVPRIIKKYRLVPRYNLEEQTPFVQLEVYQDEVGPYINGRQLEPGIYNIWYENEKSIKAKLALVNEYNLLGAGLWALDNEAADFWTYYKDALNEIPYESETEIKIRTRMEYVKKYAVEEELLKIETMPPLKVQHIELTGLISEAEPEKEKLEERNVIKVLVYEVVIPFENKNKFIKIKRFYIDENNQLKAKETNLYYDTSYVKAVSTKAILVI